MKRPMSKLTRTHHAAKKMLINMSPHEIAAKEKFLSAVKGIGIFTPFVFEYHSRGSYIYQVSYGQSRTKPDELLYSIAALNTITNRVRVRYYPDVFDVISALPVDDRQLGGVLYATYN